MKPNHLLISALLLRLFAMAFFFHPDLKSQHFHAQYLKSGVLDIYTFIAVHKASLPYTDTFNYPPLAYFTLGTVNAAAQSLFSPALTAWLSDWSTYATQNHPQVMAFLLFLKLPYLAADFAILLLLKRLVPANYQKMLTYLWLFNPVSVYAIYLLGQFDVLPALLTVLALVSVSRRRLIWACIFLALASSLKTYPLLLMPFVFFRFTKFGQLAKSAVISALVYLLPLLSFLNSIPALTSIFNSPLSSRIFITSIDLGFDEKLVLFIVYYTWVILLSWHRRSHSDLLPEFLATTLGLILFTHYHPQWLTWALPFLVLSLTRHRQLLWPTLLFTSAFFANVFLTADRFVFVGLFSVLNSRLLSLPSLAELVSPFYSPFLLQSLFHSILFAAGIWLIYSTHQSTPHDP